MRAFIILILTFFLVEAAGAQTVAANVITPNAADQFTYDNQSMPHYGIKWSADSWNTGGWTNWQSGYSGIKFFTFAQPRLVINELGNIGIGTTAPTSKLDIRGRVSVPEIAFVNADGADDTDPYRLRRVRSASNTHWLELQLNDDPDESFRIYGNSCVGYNCSEYSGNLYHSFDASGNVYHAGNVGIGTKSPTEKLSVNGNIRSKKVIVTQTGWADYVFDSTYRLRPLEEVHAYVQDKGHLPGMPSAKEIESNGLDLGDIVKQQQVKIEELTLYTIEQDNAKKALKSELVTQQQQLALQQKQLSEQALLLQQLQLQLQQLQKSVQKN